MTETADLIAAAVRRYMMQTNGYTRDDWTYSSIAAHALAALADAGYVIVKADGPVVVTPDGQVTAVGQVGWWHLDPASGAEPGAWCNHYAIERGGECGHPEHGEWVPVWAATGDGTAPEPDAARRASNVQAMPNPYSAAEERVRDLMDSLAESVTAAKKARADKLADDLGATGDGTR